MLDKIIQKIKCGMPFSFDYFGHKNVKVIRKLSFQSELIECKDCGKQYAINHDVRVVLPWGDVRSFYREMEQAGLNGAEINRCFS